jgi:hypothetical protein
MGKTIDEAEMRWAVLDIRGDQTRSRERYGRVVSIHDTFSSAQDARDAIAAEQTAGMRNVLNHLMWTVGQISDGAVGDRVTYR